MYQATQGTALAAGRNGDVYIGTTASGLLRFDGLTGKTVRYH